MANPDTLAKSPKTFLDRDNWMRAILASDLPDNAKAVALAIALHLRVKTGKCNPSYPTLAAESHVGERSTYRLVSLLESAGWLSVQRTQGRLSNQYVLLNPANHVAGLQRANPANSTLPNRPPNPANKLAGKKRKRKIPSGSCYATPLKAGERDALTRDDSSSIGGSALNAAPDLFLEPGESSRIKTQTEPEAPKRTPEGECAEGVEILPAAVIAERESSEHWRELRALWQRGHAADNTPKAIAVAKALFAKALHIAKAPDILDGARVSKRTFRIMQAGVQPDRGGTNAAAAEFNDNKEVIEAVLCGSEAEQRKWELTPPPMSRAELDAARERVRAENRARATRAAATRAARKKR